MCGTAGHLTKISDTYCCMCLHALPVQGKIVTSVAAGAEHTVVASSDGEVNDNKHTATAALQIA